MAIPTQKKKISAKSKKKTPGKSPVTKSWLETCLDRSQKEFDDKAQELVWQINVGGSSKNIHILDTIRSLHWHYLQLAAYTLGVRQEQSEKAK